MAFLVVGDPFGATTHTDLALRAKERGITISVVHNTSIMNAVGCCGLQLYRYGQTISIVFFTDNWRPHSFYGKLASNRAAGVHTLCLLDIKVQEQSEENLCRGRLVYEKPRYMSVNLAAKQLLEVEEAEKGGAYGPETECIGLARVGGVDQLVVRGTLLELTTVDFGAPVHSLVMAGVIDECERMMVDALCKPASECSQVVEEPEEEDERFDGK